MSLGQQIVGACGFAGCIICGFSWLYWLRKIADDVNSTMPRDQQVTWGITENPPTAAMHRFWDQHGQLFPSSKKRMYAAASIVLGFVIGIASVAAYFLMA